MVTKLIVDMWVDADWIREQVGFSCDHWCDEAPNEVGFCAGHWMDCILPDKRRDPQYPVIVESLRVHGFLKALCIKEHYAFPTLVMGNGHHRLAAALELGIDKIPFVMSENQDHMLKDSTEIPYTMWTGIVKDTPSLSKMSAEIFFKEC